MQIYLHSFASVLKALESVYVFISDGNVFQICRPLTDKKDRPNAVMFFACLQSPLTALVVVASLLENFLII